jgi:leucyl-tRNA synthetase
MAPFDQTTQWSEDGINGCFRFLRRVWELVLDAHTATDGRRFDGEDGELTRLLHQTIRRTTQDIERLRFNTMIAGLMTFTNALGERYRTGRWQTSAFQESTEALLRLLAPSAPHIAEELWRRTAHSGSVHQQQWPDWDNELAQDPKVTIVVQVDGRMRDRFEVPAGMPEDEVKAYALQRPKVQEHITDPGNVHVIYVPGRLINIVRR